MFPLEKQLKTARKYARQFKTDAASPAALDALVKLGGCYRALGRWGRALCAFRPGYRKCCAAKSAQGKAEFLMWESNLYYHMGRYHKAIATMKRALRLAPNRNTWVSGVSYYLANPYYALGRFGRYVALQHKALIMLDLLPARVQREQAPWIKCYQAKGLMAIGKHEKARRLLAFQTRVFRRQAHRFGLPLSLLLQGQAMTQCGEIEEGQASLEEALGMYRANGQEGYVVDCHAALSENAMAGGDCRAAREHANLAVRLARKGPRVGEGLADKRHLTCALRQRDRVKVALELQSELRAVKCARSLPPDGEICYTPS